MVFIAYITFTGEGKKIRSHKHCILLIIHNVTELSSCAVTRPPVDSISKENLIKHSFKFYLHLSCEI